MAKRFNFFTYFFWAHYIRKMPTISRELASGGGIGDLIEPRMMSGQIGGDRINPTGGRLVGMGAGREDLLDGEIVDPNTGKTQEILVSNNEHVIPEYTLFALGSGTAHDEVVLFPPVRLVPPPIPWGRKMTVLMTAL